MANRQMFSLDVIDTDRFLEMPVTTQALYFHLGMNANDNGTVEVYPVMRSIRATADDLKVLISKGYATMITDNTAVLKLT